MDETPAPFEVQPEFHVRALQQTLADATQQNTIMAAAIMQLQAMVAGLQAELDKRPEADGSDEAPSSAYPPLHAKPA